MTPMTLRDCFLMMFSKVSSGFVAGIALTLSLPSSSWANGVITFTADNAAEIFINGESLGQTNNWQNPFTFSVEDLNLQQGTNVIGIAAWDSEGIAAMSGEFVMPDGTEFGTSDPGWLAFPADQIPRDDNGANNPYNKDQEDPLVEYKDILDVPPDWNMVDYEVSDYMGKEWVVPGSVNENTYDKTINKFPWGAGTTGDPTWLWMGENSVTTSSDWWSNNFVLFRFEFVCLDNFCDSEVGWEENQLIDIDSRSWNDIIGSDFAGEEANTYPYFAGGTLSFEGFDGEEEGADYGSDFYVGEYEGNTIDSHGNFINLTGKITGPGGLTFKGSAQETGPENIHLSGDIDYEGETIVATSDGVALVVKEESAAPKGDVTVRDGAIFQLDADNIELKEGFALENGGKVSIYGEVVRIKSDVVLTSEESEFYVDEELPRGQKNEEGNWTRPEINGEISGSGGLLKTGGGFLDLTGKNTYSGPTLIEEGTLYLSSSAALNPVTTVAIAKDSKFTLNTDSEVAELTGEGDVQFDGAYDLAVGGRHGSFEFSGSIYGDGGLTKRGDGTMTLSGINTYTGETTIEEGVLSLTNLLGIPQGSITLVTGSGQLDLLSGPTGGGEFKIDQLTVTEGGQVFVSPSNPLVSETITLDANPAGQSDAGGIVTFLDARDNPPLRVTDSFNYESGSLVVVTPNPDDPEGVWQIIEGDVEDVDGLAANTYILVSDGEAYPFEGVGEEFGFDGTALYRGYLAEGSLDLVIEKKSTDELLCDLDPNAEGCDDKGPSKPVEPPICEGDDCDGKPEKPDPDPLPGCEEGDDLCDIISDIPGDEDDASEEEEEDAGEIVDALLDGFEDEEIDMPLSFDYGQLARLVGSGLAPRNVDAAGRGLALHNNLLVDVVFDRQPLRQFEELLVAEEVVEESVMEGEAVIEEAAPVQPLWLKSDQLADREAAEYVEAAVEDVEVADSAVAGAAESETVVVEFDGVSYFDPQDDELDLAKSDGVSAWVKGFGGNSRADESSILYNDYDLTAYGTSVGVDVALSESFQIGAYANYGDLNVHQHSGETGGGSWNPEGWGGGLTAQYSTRHFYVQGLLGASEFNGEQSRNILEISDDLGGNTAKGDKSVTSYVGALRIGAPFKTGGVVLEPQGQVVWTRNHERGFSETSGTEKNLRLKYKSRTTNFAETELGMKLSVPIRTGERALLVPSLRAAWLADWNQGNEGQEIGYKFTKKTVNFDSQLGTENGALIEAGLDYTVQNFNSVSVKLYGRGGMEFWASDRGTTWRASGGVTFQF